MINAFDCPIEFMHPLVVSTVYQLYQTGQSIEQIATTMRIEYNTNLDEQEINSIIDRKNEACGIA